MTRKIKVEVPMDIRNSRSRRKTSLDQARLVATKEHMQVPKVGQDQVPGGVHYWHANPLQMVYGSLSQLDEMSNPIIRSRFVTRS